MNINKYKDIDYFFYHDTIDLTDEVSADIMRGLLQPIKSLFYARNIDSVGLSDYENWPDSVFFEVYVRFAIIDFIAKRNLYVTDGSDNEKDRRVLSSQSVIDIIPDGNGNKNIEVLFVLMANIQKPQAIQVPVGVQI